MLSRAVLTDSDVVRATELLEESGAKQWVTDFVHRETNLALQALEGLPIPPHVRAEFQQIVEFVSDRSS